MRGSGWSEGAEHPIKEALGRSFVALSSEQKITGLTRGIDDSIQISFSAFDLAICPIDMVALVGRFPMRETVLVELQGVGMHSAPDTTDVYRESSLGEPCARYSYAKGYCRLSLCESEGTNVCNAF